MTQHLAPEESPELFFGLVAPVGVDLDLVVEVLTQTLKELGYQADPLRLTSLMREIPIDKEISDTPYINSFLDRIAYANAVREKLGDDGLAALAISAIRSFRATTSKERGGKTPKGRLPEETPLASQAYIIRQLKRPEEITLFRRIYGRQFIAVSAYAPHDARCKKIAEAERKSRGGLVSDVEAKNAAFALVSKDANENLDNHGQNVRDAFPLGDVFIDATSRAACEQTLVRFLRLLFGHNQITPTRDEYGMYIAKSASLRSSDLSRQVGAAVFRASGEIATMGCNEVPRAGGGTYWAGDANDHRDFVAGHDPNDLRKVELLVDLLDRLARGENLSTKLSDIKDPNEIAKLLLTDEGHLSVASSKLMDVIEFGRIIHAEMSAICDAARKGVPVDGATLYCTTFPCHLCAKHIVASGISRVVYLEPYPKSYASDLHGDSIAIENPGVVGKVSFDPFIGVSPFRYRDLFEKGKRKYSGGIARKWSKGKAKPMIEVYYPSYFEAETYVVRALEKAVKPLLSAPEVTRSRGKPARS